MIIPNNIKPRLQFVIVIVIFFHTFLSSLFSYVKDLTKIPETLVSWNIIIGFFLIIYLMTETMKKDFKKKWVSKLITNMLLIEVGSFLPLFLLGLVGSLKYPIIIWIYKFITIASVACMEFIPLGIIILFIVNIFLHDYDSQS